MSVTKPLMLPYNHHMRGDSANKGIHIPYHSQESLFSQFDSCSISSGVSSITTSSVPSTEDENPQNSFTISMSSLCKVPSRFIFKDAKKSSAKHGGFFSNIFQHSTKSPEPSTAPQNQYRVPLLEALSKRSAPSLNELYGEFTDSIYNGPMGAVRITTCPQTGKKYAVKSFRKMGRRENVQHYYNWISNEVYIGASLAHENVIQTIDVVLEKGQIHEVMEYCPQDLFNVIKNKQLTQRDIDNYFVQLMRGIAYLHHRGVAHRDLKLENLCVDEKGTLKIVDFGCAFIFLDPLSEGNHAKAWELTGSDPYIAPEIFSGKAYDAAKADIWSAAIIYLCMVLNKFPWDVAKPTESNYALYLQYRDNEDFFVHIPKQSFPLIRKMLDPNPDTRITVNEVFEDSWFKSLIV